MNLCLFMLFIFNLSLLSSLFFFFFNDTAPTEIYTLSLHDALPIYRCAPIFPLVGRPSYPLTGPQRDRKSTRLNSSHITISYAVFCLKKKKKTHKGDMKIKKKKDKKKTYINKKYI